MNDLDAFKARFGFARSDVTLANWRSAPYSRWSFQHVTELVPSAIVKRADETWALPERRDESLLEAALPAPAGRESMNDFLSRSFTDSLLVLKSGTLVLEQHAPQADPGARHLLFSVSKSLTGVLAGALECRGTLEPHRPVTDYIPQARGSAYGTCTVRHLLDMRVNLAFDESYLDSHGEFARYRRAMLWNPPLQDAPEETLPEFLLSLRPGDGAAGGPFHYASPNTDVLGLVLERASGERYPDLMSSLLWAPLGAARDGLVTVGAGGTARAAGGVCATAHDLARLGELLRNDGSRSGREVMPAAWIHDMRRNGDRLAWRTGEFRDFMPGGRYRSQWYQVGDDHDAFCAVGIHGQWLYVDPVAEVVIVKLSCQPQPQDDDLDQSSLAFFHHLSRLV